VKNYVITRRRGWSSSDDLEAASARSKRVGEQELPDDVRWIRTYVVQEEDGTLGTLCIYQATGPEAIREHASRADVPANEILEIAELVVVRADPEPAHA
jgi:hypothetical protein